MNTYTPINALEPMAGLEQLFMIERVSQRYAANNKPFLHLKLRDLTGSITCCIWNTKLTPDLGPGKFITITGNVETYSDELQINIKNWRSYAGNPDNLSDYVFCPNPNVIKVYLAELETFLDTVEDPEYRDIVRNASDRLKIPDRMSESPYGFEGRLAYPGGLLLQTVYLIRLASNLIASFADCRIKINRDLVIIGIIFRNLGWWVTSYQDGNIFTPNDISHYMGVRFASAMVANHTCMNVESDMHVKINLIKKLGLQQIAFAQEDTPNLIPEARLILQAEAIVDTMEFSI